MKQEKPIELSSRPPKELYACLVCNHRFSSRKAKCPNCMSSKVVRDELYVCPETDKVYSCKCENSYFKIAAAPARGIYFKCANCGERHWPSNIGLTELKVLT